MLPKGVNLRVQLGIASKEDMKLYNKTLRAEGIFPQRPPRRISRLRKVEEKE